MSSCKACKREIYWIDINGKPKPFDDISGYQPHKCAEWENQKQSIQQQIAEIREQQQIDHNLIVKLISKIENSDKRYEL